jgi:hypothetical protein
MSSKVVPFGDQFDRFTYHYNTLFIYGGAYYDNITFCGSQEFDMKFTRDRCEGLSFRSICNHIEEE